MTTFNPQQQLAIDALNQNVIVSASAGAGKTTVLIARLMKRIIHDNVRIDEVCAMTFTEAAASEMKTRLLAALNQEYETHATPFIAEQIALVETAQISTIHSFCLTIIKNYGYIIGMNPERAENILDDASVTLLQNRALDATLDGWLQTNPEATERLLDTFSTNPIDFDGLKDALQTTASWLLSKKEPLAEAARTLNLYQTDNFDALPPIFKDYFFHQYLHAIQAIKTNIQTLVSIADASYDANDKKQVKFFDQSTLLNDVFGKLLDVETAVKNHDILFYDSFQDLFNFKLHADTKNEDYTKARKQLGDSIHDILEYHRPLEAQFALLHEQYDDVANLLHMTQDFMSAYNNIKISENCLDFSDFESLALEILTVNNFEIATLVQPRYQEIMVDEFQDTNEYQDEIIRLISNGTNIFRVGDIKQSIYRFRGAKPNIMQDLMKDTTTQNLFLSFNYRSKKDIVDYNNYVFDKLMNLSLGISYSEHDHVNVGIPQQSEDSHPVEFHIIERGDRYFEASVNQQRADYIAQEIIKFHKQGYAFKDMVILVRSHASKAYLKEAFVAANIPHYIDDRSGFYNSEVIQDIIHILNYALNRHDFYLVYVLKSVFIGYSDDKIAALKLSGHASIKEALKIMDPQTHFMIHDAIRTWRTKDVVSIIQDIIVMRNTYQSQLSLQDKTNVDFLLEKAVQYQASRTPTLLGFIRFIREFKDDTSSEASPLSKDADVVTSMTIHQSKGLQFPIVFLWGLGKHTVRDHTSTLVTDDALGLALNHIQMPYRTQEKNMLRTIVEYKQDHEELEESLRLLYVALTRPQKHLILVDVTKEFKPEPLSSALLRGHRNKTELLFAASPPSRILKVIDAEEIGTEKLQGQVTTVQNESFDTTFEMVPEPVLIAQNTLLDPDKYSEFGMVYGTILHESIEALPNRTWTHDDLSSIEARFHQPLMTYNAHPFTQQLYLAPIIEKEIPFIDANSEGIIDFFAQSDKEIVIVDFKSDNADAATLWQRYAPQVDGYIAMMRSYYPNHNVSAYIYSFHLQTYLKRDYTL